MSTRFTLLTIKLIFSLAILSPVSVFGQEACLVTVQAAQFLHQKNPTLHTSKPVELMNTGSLQKPADKILNWLKHLESATKKHQTNPTALRLIKESYFKAHLTKPEDVPDSFYQLQVQIAREQGRGTIQLTESTKKQLRETSLKDQKDSLEAWLDYFLSPDSDSYPMWAKLWSFNGMVKLGKFNPEDGTFSSRSKGQMSAFPELNREAFATVIDAIVKKVNGQSLESIQDPKFLSLLDGANFGKLYGHALKQVTTKTVAPKSENGKWVVYKQDSDPTALVDSLKGWNTGWCTAGFQTAKSQLQHGDFHVFYSQNFDGQFNVPRIAIRMEGDDIAEVRGTAANQNLDPQIVKTQVLENRMSEFGDKSKAYQKKTDNMKLLTEIETKHQKNIELSKLDLRFLYEVDAKIDGFGYQKDPRIDEITSQRDKRSDLAFVLNLKPYQVSVNAEQAIAGDIIYHLGDLNLSNLKSAEGLTLPKNFNGTLDLNYLTSAKGLTLPTHFKGTLRLYSLTSPEGLTLPSDFAGDIYLITLTSIEGVKIPNNFKGELYLNSLESAKGLIIPNGFEGRLMLTSLKSAEGLTLPKNFKGNLSLTSLESAKGLTLPENFEGYLNLSRLTLPEGLILPDNFNGELVLSGLRSAEGLSLPQTFNGSLNLSGLTSAKGLNLPKNFEGYLNLYSIKSAEGLILPNNFTGNLTLSSITSAIGLNLPENFTGNIRFDRLTSLKGLILPNNFSGSLSFGTLTSIEGFVIPDSFEGTIYLNKNSDAKNFKLPKNSKAKIEFF